MRALEAEGLIARHQGRGTFVCDTGTPRASVTALESLYSAEFETPARILARGQTAVPARLLAYFSDCEALAFVDRLAFRDGQPWSFGRLYFLIEFVAAVSDARLRTLPLYRILDEACGVKLAQSHFDAQARAAAPVTASHLGVDPLSPVLSLAAVSYDATGRAVGAFEMDFPAAPFTFTFTTQHSGG